MLIYINSSSGDKLLGFYTQFTFCVVILIHTHPHTIDRHTAWADTAKLYFLNVSAAMFQNYQNQQADHIKPKLLLSPCIFQTKYILKK